MNRLTFIKSGIAALIGIALPKMWMGGPPVESIECTEWIPMDLTKIDTPFVCENVVHLGGMVSTRPGARIIFEFPSHPAKFNKTEWDFLNNRVRFFRQKQEELTLANNLVV